MKFSLFGRYVYKLWTKWNQISSRKFTTHNYLYCFFAAWSVKKLIGDKDFDCIVIGAGEPQLAAFLQTDIPIIYIADTTFALMVDYYPWHTGLCAAAIRQGNYMESRMISKSFRILYSSQWAADSAIGDYGASPEKILVSAFGPCLEQIPSREEIGRKSNQICQLLFIGVDWVRKGGPKAFEIYKQLKHSGVACHLTIIGSDPKLDADPACTVIPFLDKNDPTHQKIFYNIFLAADFLILPSKADCTPVVLSEAAAFGIPAITKATGGIPFIVQNGKNGYCLPYNASPEEFSASIRELWLSAKAYKDLKLSSRIEYERRLNWDSWRKIFNEAVKPLLLNDKKSTDNIF